MSEETAQNQAHIPAVAVIGGGSASGALTQLVAGTSTSQVVVVLFDADAPEQKVQLGLERKGKVYKVAHLFVSPSDDDLLEYERRRNVRMREANKTELGERGLAMQNDSESAAVWLWNKLAVRVEGYKPNDEWREKVSVQDKEYAISQGLLACEPFSKEPEIAADDDLLDFDADTTASNTIELNCFFNGKELTLTHILRDASADDVKNYRALMKTSYTVRGQKLGKSDIRIPSKAKALGKLYDGVLLETKGYAGRVPLHHKMAVALEHFGQEQETLSGN